MSPTTLSQHSALPGVGTPAELGFISFPCLGVSQLMGSSDSARVAGGTEQALGQQGQGSTRDRKGPGAAVPG